MFQAFVNAFCLWQMTMWFKKNHEQSHFINWNNPIQVCLSGAGYYIGQLDGGVPATRLSCDYYRTYEEAEELMLSGTFNPKTWL